MFIGSTFSQGHYSGNLVSFSNVQTPSTVVFRRQLYESKLLARTVDTMWNIVCSITVVTLMLQGITTSHENSISGDDSRPRNDEMGRSSTLMKSLMDNFSKNIIANPIAENHTCPLDCACGAIGQRARIVGGTRTYPQKYPWMAKLMIVGVLCAGVLINDKYVVTAAHCVFDLTANDVVVRLLEQNVYSTNLKRIDFKVKKIIVHEKFKNLDNDIALLRLETGGILFGSDSGLNPVCLPPSGETYAGYIGIAAGWGCRKLNCCPSDELLEAKIPIISNEKCMAELNTIIGTNYIIEDENMCAQDAVRGRNVAPGDSGGPLVIAENGTYFLVGLVSWGSESLNSKHPAVYTRVNKYLSWLETNMPDACPCSNKYLKKN